MLKKTKFSGFVAAAVLAFSFVGPASAATISWSDGSSPAPNPAFTSSTGAVQENLVASVLYTVKSPFEGSIIPNTPFNSVGARGAGTYAFSSVRSTLKLIWGSVDQYNFIDFYRGINKVDTLIGVDDPEGKNRPLTEILASIVVSGGFDRVVLRSDRNSFEHASVAAVPVPAAGFLLVGALGGLAALRRRKKVA
jgi:hypothetical protein